MVPTEATEALAESMFGQEMYYPHCFNDLASGMVTLFILLVVNDWHVIVSGYVAVWGAHARIFFATFYLCGVVIILNIVIAFVIETYQQLDRHHHESARQLASGSALHNDTFVLKMPKLARADAAAAAAAAAAPAAGTGARGAEAEEEEEPGEFALSLRDTQLQPLERRELLVRLVTPLGAALHPLPSEETGSSADLARLLPPETGTV